MLQGRLPASKELARGRLDVLHLLAALVLVLLGLPAYYENNRHSD